jgi:HSP20 family protein
MAFVSLDPVEGLMRLQEELDRFFGKPPFDLGLTGPNVFPPINVFTDQEGWVVQAEVPGVKPGELQVQVENGRLAISGERTPATEPNKGVSYHRRERRYGKFSRTIQLPRDLDPEKVRAELRNGLLTIRIPKLASAKPRQIEVQAA